VADRVRVLVTGAGAPGGPGIIKALRRDPDLSVHGADMNPLASGSFLCEAFHRIPKAADPGFVSALLEVCRGHGIAAIFPRVTRELFKFAEHACEFEEDGIRVIVSEQAALGVANDKGRLYAHMRAHGIPAPDFRIVTDAAGLEAAARTLGYPDRAVVMKPCVGNGSRGIRVLDPGRDRFQLLFGEKPTTLFSSLEEVLAVIGTRAIPELVVSEYLPGRELTVDCIAGGGEVLEMLIRTRDTINSGISTSGRFIGEPAVEAYLRRVVSSLPGLRGPVGFQVKESASGAFLMLECNPRIQGTSVAALGCGVNLPLLAVYQALGRPAPAGDRRERVGFVRHYDEIFYEY
jgi:carbamoyl-phosphate synthase large subunit